MSYKKRYKCYFAHPWESRGSPEEAEIIEELKLRLVDVVNPFDNEDEIWTRYGRTGYYPDPPYKLGREIWIKDLKSITECDMFLVYVPEGKRLTGGCGYELAKAYDQHKFIQIISMSRHPAFAYVLTGTNQMFENIKDWKKYYKLRWK